MLPKDRGRGVLKVIDGMANNVGPTRQNADATIRRIAELRQGSARRRRGSAGQRGSLSERPITSAHRMKVVRGRTGGGSRRRKQPRHIQNGSRIRAEPSGK